MKTFPGRLALCLLIWAGLIFCAGNSATAQPDDAEKTLSPYFLVKSDDPETDQLPLKATSADVSIAGVIADVTVTQVYENKGTRTLEAIYVFPASTRAAVHGMKMTIGERTITAQIREREQARQEYEAAKKAGQSASLLEQQRPNVFQMNVANILPGDVIEVELRYTELLVPTDGVYEFVYPTVVGPRYSELPEENAPTYEQWVQNPYLHEGEAPPYKFGFKAAISAGMPIAQVVCPSHETNIAFSSPATADIQLASSENKGGNRDLILKYRLAGGQIETGLLLYKGETENFFLLMLQPPRRVTLESIPPREYVFIVDVSGSMRGFPLNTTKTLLQDLIGNLRPEDRFNVLLFAGGSRMFETRSVPATEANIARAVSFIDNQQGGGGTQLLPAMERALKLPAEGAVSRSLVAITDGYVRVETETFDLIRNHLGEANLFAFGIGSSVNRFLIKGMARVGMGEPFVVTKPEDAPATAARFRDYVQSPVLTNIGLDFNGFQVYDVEPPSIPDLLAERPLIVYGKWKGDPKGTIQVTGVTGNGRTYKADLNAAQFQPDSAHAGLRHLWARKRIHLLSDFQLVSKGSELAKEITQLGLEYNLLTAHTSFVAIDSQVRADGESTTVKQPLPLPQGVSDSAVGMGITRMAPLPNMNAAPMSEKEMLNRRIMANFQSNLGKKATKAKEAEKPVQVMFHRRDITVSGGLTVADIDQVIRGHLTEIETCAAQLLASNPSFKGGKAILMLTIDANGKVSAAVVRGAIGATQMGPCLTKLTEKWHFKPTVGNGVIATVALMVNVRR